MSSVRAPGSAGDRRLRVWRLAGIGAVVFGGGLLLAYRWIGGQAETQEIGVATSPDIAAQFAAIQGNVKTRGVGGLDWKTAELKLPLRKSDLVRTYPSSSAEIRFFDETRVTVRPDSLITIEETSRGPRSEGAKVAWKVSSGEINYETARKETGSTEAFTPTFRLALEGNSAGTMRVGEGGLTAVAQHAGAANLETRAGERIRLIANEGIRVDAAGRAGAKQVLPETPTLTPPGEAGVLSLPEGTPVTLSWTAAAGASQYRVLVELRTSSGPEQVFDRDGIRGTSVDIPGLIEGNFVARVAGQTADGVLGRFSPPVGFGLTRLVPKGGATPPPVGPRLSIEAFEARGNVLRLVGRTEPGARLLVNGDPVAVQADGSFREFVTLPRRQGDVRIVIRAISAAGGVTEDARTLAPGQ